MSAELTKQEWDVLGPNSDKPCDMCGNTETKIVRRGHHYATCKEHAHIPPVFRMEVKDYENV